MLSTKYKTLYVNSVFSAKNGITNEHFFFSILQKFLHICHQTKHGQIIIAPILLHTFVFAPLQTTDSSSLSKDEYFNSPGWFVHIMRELRDKTRPHCPST